MQDRSSRTLQGPASVPFTYGEIFQQPELWLTTWEIVRRSGWVNDKPNRPVVIAGAGTSAYAASAIAASWPNAQSVATTDLLVESRAELARRSPHFTDSGLLVSIGRSGDSPESVAVVRRIQRLCPHVAHLAITCNPDGQLARTRGVYSIVLDRRTNDRGLAMTSSFSNLVLAGFCLQHLQEIEGFLQSVCREGERLLPVLEETAKRIAAKTSERAVVLGTGSMQPVAAEACLKILEMTAGRVVTLPESFLGLRHGPMSFIRPHTLVLCFLSSSPERRRYEEDLIRELRQKGLGYIVAIAPQGADSSLFDELIPAVGGYVRDELRVPFEIPFAQLLAYHLSVKEGLDPDNPSPAGAITRVVEKFVIYDENGDV